MAAKREPHRYKNEQTVPSSNKSGQFKEAMTSGAPSLPTSGVEPRQL